MLIRPYHHSDAEALSAPYARAVSQTGPRAYSPDQVAAWLSLTPDAARIGAMMAGRWCFVATTDTPAGFIDLESDGHIDMLYVAPEATSMGVGWHLYQHAEAFAREQGLTRLYTEASEIARPFFERQGFRVLHRRDLNLSGVAIHNYAMEKLLGTD
ncbi:MAG: GNAT family N-acetyltransferase [Asticcacaulis sp.]